MRILRLNDEGSEEMRCMLIKIGNIKILLDCGYENGGIEKYLKITEDLIGIDLVIITSP